jgi:hypothetical protein
MPQSPTPAFLPLTGLYEPSAIQQLPDGRFLVVEDEKEHSFSLVTLSADGIVKHMPLGPAWFHGGDAIWNMDDLEGLTMDNQGFLYTVTSHSRDVHGEQKKSRDKLARFRIKDGKVVEPMVVGGLRRALVTAHPVLAAAAKVEDAKSDGGLNMEALEITPDRQRLLVGFRSPLQAGLALIASVENPVAIFESGEEPQVSGKLQTLDLGGDGIRGMAWVASLGAYLVISGPTSPADGAFGLWFWNGKPNGPARRVSVDGLQGLERAEGVSTAVMDGVERIVIVSDDGNREKGKCAQFILLDLGQLRIAP